MAADPITLAVLVSGSGTTLQNLIDVIAAGELHARIVMVIGSRSDLAGVRRAQHANIPTCVVDRKEFKDVPAFSRRVFDALDAEHPTLVCLAGWLCLLEIPPNYAGRVINIHPSLLPEFGGHGMYGLRVHQAVLDDGRSVSGCTVHFVDNKYDNGPIILQRTCDVLVGDTAKSLAARVFEQEKIAYPDAIRQLFRR